MRCEGVDAQEEEGMFDSLCKRFGALAVWLGLCDETAVLRALDDDDSAPIGERLTRNGDLAPGQAERVLEAQRLLGDAPTRSMSRLHLRVPAFDANRPVAEMGGVVDGHADPERLLDALLLDRLDDGFVLSLRRLEYLNREGVAVLTDLWARRPFVICETPPVFALLLTELGADALIPVVEHRADAFSVDLPLPETGAPEETDAVRPERRVSREAAPTFTVDIAAEGDAPVVRLDGDLEPSAALSNLSMLESAVGHARWDSVVLDATGVTRSSHDGLVILGAFPEDCRLYIAARDPLRGQLSLLGLDRVHPVFDDADDAVAALRADEHN